MIAEHLGTFAHDSPRWHAARAHGLGGSEIAAVLGLSPWESHFSLWHRKKQLVAGIAGTEVMRWGTAMEAPIADWLATEHPDYDLVEPGTWRHPARPWQIANPDRFALSEVETRIVEIKTARGGEGWGEPGTDQIPIYYRTQVLWYMDVLDLSPATVAVSISGRPPVEYTVPYDPEDAALLRDAGHAFMESLRAGPRPDIDAHSETYHVIRELHPDIDDDAVEVPAELATDYVASIRAHAAAEKQRDLMRSRLADHMGRARRAYHGGHQIAMRIGKGGHPPYVKATPPKDVDRKGKAA